MSTGSADGFSVDFGVAPVLRRTLVFVFLGVGSWMDGLPSPPGISTSISISDASLSWSECAGWASFLWRSPKPWKAGTSGYNGTLAAPPGDNGQIGIEAAPLPAAPPGVPGTKSKVVANGFSFGGDSKSSGRVVAVEMRRIVVVVGACERLSRAFEGAGIPWRLDCPGIGSAGSSNATLGSDVGSVDDDSAAPLLERLEEDEDIVASVLDALRLRPKEVAMALREDPTLEAVKSSEDSSAGVERSVVNDGPLEALVPNSPAWVFVLPRLLLRVLSSTSAIESMTISHCSLGRGMVMDDLAEPPCPR